MKVYSGAGYGEQSVFVTPGHEHPEVDEFTHDTVNDDGKKIRKLSMLKVHFHRGAAEVSRELGKYLIAKQLASRLPVPFDEPAIPHPGLA